MPQRSEFTCVSISSNWNKVKKWNFSFGSFFRFYYLVFVLSFVIWLSTRVRIVISGLRDYCSSHAYAKHIDASRSINMNNENPNFWPFIRGKDPRRNFDYYFATRMNEKSYDNELLHEKINWHFSHGWLMRISDFFVPIFSTCVAMHSMQHFCFHCKIHFPRSQINSI